MAIRLQSCHGGHKFTPWLIFHCLCARPLFTTTASPTLTLHVQFWCYCLCIVLFTLSAFIQKHTLRAESLKYNCEASVCWTRENSVQLNCEKNNTDTERINRCPREQHSNRVSHVISFFFTNCNARNSHFSPTGSSYLPHPPPAQSCSWSDNEPRPIPWHTVFNQWGI